MNPASKKSSIFFLLYIAVIINSVVITQTHAFNCNSEVKKDDVWITVFIHGIISIKSHTTVTNFIRFLTDNVADSPYGMTVEMMRNDPFFYQNHTIQKCGLHSIDLSNYQKGAAASIMARLFDKVNHINNPCPCTNYYYTYGWSGLLSRISRYKAAKELLCQLNELIATFHSKGINPKIRLLGFSHGGTIILKLALVKQIEKIIPNFHIDEAYLLGTPIQHDTDYLINDPLFKRIYNVYSKGDRVQKLDFFSCGQFFSDKIFKVHKGCGQIPNKLSQIELAVIRKKGECLKPFKPEDAQQPLLFDGNKSCRSIRNISPGHGELWFFGWTPLHYRKTFLLYPLPMIVFLPYIINTIKSIEANTEAQTPIRVTIDPRRDSMIINTNLCGVCPYLFPFIGIQSLIDLQTEALAYRPDLNYYNIKTFNDRIEKAYKKADAELKIKKCRK